jgi:hypothetical protein
MATCFSLPSSSGAGHGKLGAKSPAGLRRCIDDAGGPDIPQTGDASTKRMLPSHAPYSGLQKQNFFGRLNEFPKRTDSRAASPVGAHCGHAATCDA